MKLCFCLQLKANEYVKLESELLCQLCGLGLRPGGQCFCQGVRVTKAKEFGAFNIAAKWQHKRITDSPKDPWYLFTNLGDLSSALDTYPTKRGFRLKKCLEISGEEATT
jgi:hypothetical protein